jgi:hypothetical protein
MNFAKKEIEQLAKKNDLNRIDGLIIPQIKTCVGHIFKHEIENQQKKYLLILLCVEENSKIQWIIIGQIL